MIFSRLTFSYASRRRPSGHVAGNARPRQRARTRTASTPAGSAGLARGGLLRRLALGAQHRADALGRTAAAGPDRLEARRQAFVQRDAVVVRQFFADPQRPQALDQHAVL